MATKRFRGVQQERFGEGDSRLKTSSTKTTTTTYQACRFLVEHEATRIYPRPVNEDSDGKIGPASSLRMATTTTTPDGEKNINAHNPSEVSKVTAASTTQNETPVASVAPTKSRKQLRHARVKPRRFLEDCLTITDHGLMNSASSTAHRTIISHAHTPKLGMNSVWVELKLHKMGTPKTRKVKSMKWWSAVWKDWGFDNAYNYAAWKLLSTVSINFRLKAVLLYLCLPTWHRFLFVLSSSPEIQLIAICSSFKPSRCTVNTE